MPVPKRGHPEPVHNRRRRAGLEDPCLSQYPLQRQALLRRLLAIHSSQRAIFRFAADPDEERT